MKSNDGILVLIVIAIICVLGSVVIPVLYDSSQRSIQQDCDNFGAFVINEQKYECKRA